MTAQPLLSSTILTRVMTVFLFVLTQKRVMAPFNDNVLGLMRVMCGTKVTLLSFGTRDGHFQLKKRKKRRDIETIFGERKAREQKLQKLLQIKENIFS